MDKNLSKEGLIFETQDTNNFEKLRIFQFVNYPKKKWVS